MDKRIIEIAGYEVTQLSPTEFEAVNAEQHLDFHFDTSDEEVVIDMFDSTITSEDGYLDTFTAPNLTVAVSDAMTWAR